MIAERVITVEYLHPSMANDLLCKFPDDSAFGFNYSESGIWSPLLSRGRCSHEDKDGSAILSMDSLRKVRGRVSMKKRKRKMATNLMSVVNKRLEFSPNPKRGWKRLLKAAAKRFKLQRRAAIQMMLPTL